MRQVKEFSKKSKVDGGSPTIFPALHKLGLV